MNRQFSVDFEIGMAMPEPASVPTAEPKPLPPVWGFVNDFHAMAGENTDPDAQFFVESWTIGMAAAMRNLESRRGVKAPRVATSASSSSTAEFLEQSALREEFSCVGQRQNAKQPAAEEREEPYVYEETEPANGPMTVRRARRILGVGLFSSARQVKAAYRQLVTRWHPDRSEWTTAEARRRATEQMMLINEAYRLLHKNW